MLSLDSLNGVLALSRKEKEKALHIAQTQDYRQCKKSLLYFTKAAWDIVEPGRLFISNWHIESICDHLEAVSRGEIKKLIINVPPGTSKSTIVSTMWPPQIWTTSPEKRIMSISHEISLPVRDARKSRNIIESPWYREGFPHVVFAPDQNQKTKYENTLGGYRQSFGISGGITGQKADIILIDDPHDAKKAMSLTSAADRLMAIDTFDLAISSRTIDSNSAIVLIMQRLHEVDLSGHLLKSEGWEHLMLPMEFEPSRRCVTCLGIPDKRTVEGELLWPEYYDRAAVDAIKLRLRPVGTAGQLQQRPAPAKGGIIDTSWFRRYKVLPPRSDWLETVQSWDTAQKPDQIQNDPSVCGTWIRTIERLYLIDLYRGWLTQPQLEKYLVDLYNKHKPHRVIVEDKSSGQGLIQYAQEKTRIPVIPFEPEGDKITRLSVESSIIEAGQVWIPEEAPWVFDYIEEMQSFPFSAHKDQADMTSQVLKYFREQKETNWDAFKLISSDKNNEWTL